MLDMSATLTMNAPTVVEYFDPEPGEIYSPTVSRWFHRVIRPKPAEKAEANSKSQVMDFALCDAPEHVALQRLRRFKAFKANWDAEHSAAPNLEAIDSAIVMLSLLSAHGLTPKVALASEGAPMLLFSQGSFKAEIVVKASNLFDYYVDTPEGDGEEDIAFDGRSLPANLLNQLQA